MDDHTNRDADPVRLGSEARPRRRRLRLHPVLAWIALAPCVALGGEAELEIREAVRDYPITATDAHALQDALQHQRPRDVASASSHALTEIALSSRMPVSPAEGGCTWSGPKLVLDMRTSLPSWIDQSAASPALQAQWRSIRAGLEAHEHGHRDLAREAAHALLEQIRALEESDLRNRPCREIERRVSALQMRALTRLSLRQHAYDQRTLLGATQGAILELGDAALECRPSSRRARADCSRAMTARCTCRDPSRELSIGF